MNPDEPVTTAIMVSFAGHASRSEMVDSASGRAGSTVGRLEAVIEPAPLWGRRVHECRAIPPQRIGKLVQWAYLEEGRAPVPRALSLVG